MQNSSRVVRVLLLSLAIIAGAVLPAMAQSFNDLLQRFDTRVFTDAQGKTLPYRLLKPKNYDPKQQYPFVLFLHGAGERGTDNQAQLRVGVNLLATDAVMDKYPCFVVAPQCPGDKRWVEVNWSDDAHLIPAEPSEPMRLTLLLIDALQQEFRLDQRRFYVTGLSMGGFGTWDILARRPKLFAAGVPVCGGADEHTAAAIKHIPVWVYHGNLDGTVKTARSRNMVAALRKVGGKPKYTELINVGHNAWDYVYCNMDVYDWLFAQRNAK